MRNIALLEWGPASLYYILPRERLKVRTGWLNEGPMMPPFSGVDAYNDGQLTHAVRYCFSAFEDLNGCIRNLRRCFGFPYQESIGYLNTLTTKHRARREHQALLSGMRRWATNSNVDAIVWIDYAKANHSPGSFKVGPKAWQPFSPKHLEVCAEIPGASCDDAVHMRTSSRTREEGDSEDAWSDVDVDPKDHHHSHAAGHATATATAAEPGGGDHRSQTKMGGGDRRSQSKMVESPSDLKRPTIKIDHCLSGLAVLRSKYSQWVDRPTALSGSPLPRNRAVQPLQPIDKAKYEEVRPKIGSIYYPRTVSPGPGYYSLTPQPEKQVILGPTFGRKLVSPCDQQAGLGTRRAVVSPGPGEYDLGTTAAEDKLGTFGRSIRFDCLAPDTPRKRQHLAISGKRAIQRLISRGGTN